jgi:hypothetical protein
MQQNIVSTPTPAQEQIPAVKLLKSVWRSQDRAHFICTLDKATAKFRNVAVKSLEEAVSFASAYSAMGLDAYFTFAEYATTDNRKTENAVGAWAFIVDIDVGPDKAATGRGYATIEEALTVLKEFCEKTGLPYPPIVANSGTGVHGYWVFDEFLDREQWQAYAAKLKALMKSIGLLADPSRTADIASVLRVPGTLNYKYAPARPVTILSSLEERIELTVMLDAIDAAMVTLGAAAEVATSKAEMGMSFAASAPFSSDYASEPPDLLKLTSALKALDPDCEEKLWKFYRLGPLAYAAREFPELADALHDMAIRWSSGELRGIPSKKWGTASANGMNGQTAFKYAWKRFMTDNYQGKRVTIGSIYFHAAEVGWIYTPEQSQGSNDDEEKSA